MSNLTLPSMLSYSGSIKPGAAFYEAVIGTGANATRVPVAVVETTLKGTMANYFEVKNARDQGAVVKALGRPNLQTIHQALLPAGTTAFEMQYTLNVIPNALMPHNCNDNVVGKALHNFMARYNKVGGSQYLASRYVTNLLRGAWLWRNADQFESGTIEVTVKIDGVDKTFTNNSFSNRACLKQVAGSEELIVLVGKALAGEIRDSDTGFTKSIVLRVKACMDAFPGQEVYPSQEFVNDKEHPVSRVLASVKSAGNVDQAIMHPQKIGNALRRIDDWYTPLDGFDLNPLAVEPLGVDSSMQVAHRASSAKDFYTLVEKQFGNLMASLESAASVDDLQADHHYLAAVMSRGGVFSGESEADKARKEKAKKDKAKKDKEIMAEI